jgi:conjugal transfer/entry exclusion protein
MERKVSRRALAVILALSCSMLPATQSAWAGGGGLTGVATEITQLANHVELVTSAIQNVKTVANTLQTVIHLKEVLRNVDPRVLAEIAGVPPEDFDALYRLNDSVNGLLGAYQSLNDQLNNFNQGVQMTGLSPSQYLQTQVLAAQRYGGYYKKVLESESNALKRAIEEQSRLSADLATINSNTGVVDSIKQMSGQLVQVRATNLSLLQQMQQANLLAAADHAAQGQAAAAYNQDALERYQKFIAAKQANYQKDMLPDPTKIDLTGGASSAQKSSTP